MAAIAEPLRTRLLYAHGAYEASERETQRAREELAGLVRQARENASLSDIAELIGVRRSTLHDLSRNGTAG